MKLPGLKLLLALAAIAAGPVASASYLTCTETVSTPVVSGFPTTVYYDLTVTDAWCVWCATQPDNHWCHEGCSTVPPTSYSPVYAESDEVLSALVGPIAWVTTQSPPSFPFALENGASVTTTVEAYLASYAACAAWARAVGVAPDEGGRVVIDDVYRIEWSTDGVPPFYAECSASLECLPPLGPTRTLGYFKTHPAAVEACLADGPVDLGFLTLTDATGALGLLTASPAKYATGSKRTALDHARVLLARQLLVAVCNGRVFGSTPADSALLGAATTALAGRSCGGMNWLQGQLDVFNNSGDTGENWFGSAAPGSYPDPTVRSSLACQ